MGEARRTTGFPCGCAVTDIWTPEKKSEVVIDYCNLHGAGPVTMQPLEALAECEPDEPWPELDAAKAFIEKVRGPKVSA